MGKIQSVLCQGILIKIIIFYASQSSKEDSIGIWYIYYHSLLWAQAVGTRYFNINLFVGCFVEEDVNY